MDMIRYFSFSRAAALLLSTVVLAVGPARGADDPGPVDLNEQQLINVLKSGAPPQEKAITCKKLAIVGTAESVPALGQLLSDPELSSWARIALEAIPDPAANAALREALGTVDDRLLVGVINTLGARRDSQAVEALTLHLQDENAQVASAAAVALGQIGGETAAAALKQALANESDDAVRSAIAEGCVLSAQQLLADGQRAAAAELYDQVLRADVPPQRIWEATRGAILAGEGNGVPALVAQLNSEDRALFHVALRTSRELSSPAVTRALLEQLATLPPDRQVPMIVTLADREDAAALTAILQAAQAGPNEVRKTAIQVLGSVGDVSCTPTLLAIAANVDGELAETAKGALEGMPGADVDQEITRRLSQAEGTMRRVLIELIGLRRIEALDALTKAASDVDPQTRAAALVALGSTVDPDHLSVLIERVERPQNDEDTPVARQALRAACVRMPDRDVCVKQLAAAMSRAAKDAQVALLETIGSVGGAEALKSLNAAAQHEQEELRDTASRVLGRWMTTDAAPVLLDLAKNQPDEKYRIRALRGYLRIARQFTFPIDERAEMFRQAFQAAERDAERKLVIEALEQYPSPQTLALAVEAAQVPSLNQDAVSAAKLIAQKVGADSQEVKDLLNKLGAVGK